MTTSLLVLAIAFALMPHLTGGSPPMADDPTPDPNAVTPPVTPVVTPAVTPAVAPIPDPLPPATPTIGDAIDAVETATAAQATADAAAKAADAALATANAALATASANLSAGLKAIGKPVVVTAPEVAIYAADDAVGFTKVIPALASTPLPVV